jgi:hypothetical protein
VCCERLDRENPRGKASLREPQDSTRYPAGFRGKSTAQRPCIEIDYSKKKNACGSCPDTDSRIGGMNAEEENPSVERKRFGLGTFSVILPLGIYHGRSTNRFN